MAFTRLVFATIVAAAVPAFSQPLLLGHQLGETVTKFLAAEPELQSRVSSCRTSVPQPMTPEQIQSLSKYDIEALAHQVYADVINSPNTTFHIKLKKLPNRSDLEDLARQGMPIVIDKRPPDEIATCTALLLLVGPPSAEPVRIASPLNSRPRPIVWVFKKGILVEMDIDFHGASFAEVSNDFSAKTGVRPDENQEVDTPNLYGATLHVSRKASWLTPELYALLEEEEGIVDGQMRAIVITRSQYDAWKQSHASRGTLD